MFTINNGLIQTQSTISIENDLKVKVYYEILDADTFSSEREIIENPHNLTELEVAMRLDEVEVFQVKCLYKLALKAMPSLRAA